MAKSHEQRMEDRRAKRPSLDGITLADVHARTAEPRTPRPVRGMQSAQPLDPFSIDGFSASGYVQWGNGGPEEGDDFYELVKAAADAGANRIWLLEAPEREGAYYVLAQVGEPRKGIDKYRQPGDDWTHVNKYVPLDEVKSTACRITAAAEAPADRALLLLKPEGYLVRFHPVNRVA